MSAFSQDSFSISAFEVNAFDFGIVTVALVGVYANPAIGVGTITGAATFSRGIGEPIRIRRPKPISPPVVIPIKDIFVVTPLQGVKADSTVGAITVLAVIDSVKAQASIGVGKIAAEFQMSAPARITVIPSSISVAFNGQPIATPIALIGEGTVETQIDFYEEELIALLEAA